MITGSRPEFSPNRIKPGLTQPPHQGGEEQGPYGSTMSNSRKNLRRGTSARRTTPHVRLTLSRQGAAVPRGRWRTAGTATTARAAAMPSADIVNSAWCNPIATTPAPHTRLPSGRSPALVR
jgi:hypothetical protein